MPMKKVFLLHIYSYSCAVTSCKNRMWSKYAEKLKTMDLYFSQFSEILQILMVHFYMFVLVPHVMHFSIINGDYDD